jgi:hypothetical protein
MKKHVLEQHREEGINLFAECKVQKISGKYFKNFIGVTADEGREGSNRGNGNMMIMEGNEIEAIVRGNMRKVLMGRKEAEPVKQKNVFYAIMGWYSEPEIRDEYWEIDKIKLLKMPKEGEEGYEVKEKIQKIFEKSIEIINKAPFSIRAIINDNEQQVGGLKDCRLESP